MSKGILYILASLFFVTFFSVASASSTVSLIANATLISAYQSVSFTNTTIGATANTTYSYSVSPNSGFIQNGNNFTFYNPGNYSVTLNVTDASGLNASSTVIVNVTPPLSITSFIANRTDISAGQWVSFTNSTAGGTGNNTYSYSLLCSVFGDPPYNVSGNNIQFTTQDACMVTLNVTDLSGEKASASTYIFVTPALAVNLTANRTQILAGQNVSFTNTTYNGTGGNMYAYSVKPDSGFNETGNVFDFTSPGTYNVTLYVTDASGEVANSSVTISVEGSLATTLKANRTYISAGQIVSFVNATTGGTGNNTYSYSVSPKSGFTESGNDFTFNNAGTYNVTLTVTDSSGDVSNSTVQITVTPVLAVSLSANSTSITAGQSVKFTNATSGGTGNNTYSYTVSREGYTRSGNNFTFSSAGVYNITLTVIDGSGEIADSTVTISVSTVLRQPGIMVDLAANRTFISADQGVKFTNTTSGGTGGNTYYYTVSPNSGFTESGNIFHFTSAGNYSVTLHVSDSSSDTNSSTVEITVTPPLATKLYANKTLISIGQSISFWNVTSGGTGSDKYILTLTGSNSSKGSGGGSGGWNNGGWGNYNNNYFFNGFGNFCGGGGGQGGKNTTGVAQQGNTLTFNSEGNYTLTIAVNDITGETATSNITITVTPQLTVTAFTANTDNIYTGQSVEFTNTTSGGTGSNVYTYVENNTAGVSQSGNKLTFSDAGKYAVTLAVSDISGETALSKTIIISVTPPPLPGCNNGNNGKAVKVTGSSKTETIVITDQSGVDITGSSNNVTIIMPGANCDIAVDVTGSSNKVNIYNGTITLTETGSSNVAALHNTVVTQQSITGSSDRVTGAILDGSAFTITGSSNLVETVQVESLGSLQLTGSGSNLTIDMLVSSKPMSTTITGSSNLVHIINGTISLKITGSSNDFYYHDTTITGQTITGSGNKIIKD